MNYHRNDFNDPDPPLTQPRNITKWTALQNVTEFLQLRSSKIGKSKISLGVKQLL